MVLESGNASPPPAPEGIAVIGMAGRFPGAGSVDGFWANLVAGRDCITRFSDDELAAAGYGDPAKLRALPGFVAARGVVDRPEWFDPAFFGMLPKEAEATDPQQRVFLEMAWEAFEDAGLDPARHGPATGIFAGAGINTYFPFFLRQRPDILRAVGATNATVANEKDFLANRLAYKLNLRGPALNVQTACSTSLVTVCVACSSLLTHGCDVALAGGISLSFPQVRGYFAGPDGGMTSPDGVCRPFDARANGTVFSNGGAVVVLKRLADAVADGDRIYAVIKGHALNNDGAGKVSFAAPGVDGQVEAIALAQAVADISPESISCLEAHGTATALGDPIEVAALTQAFRLATEARGFCALGSIKGNIGHCDAAAGIIGLVKTVLALHHEQIPATIHCEQPNPALDLEDSPFFLNTELRPWPRNPDVPRRAGVSSFGVGGTNAHVVLEEAPAPVSTPASSVVTVTAAAAIERPVQTLVLSAKTPQALERRAQDLAAHLEAHPEIPLADAAWTLQTGRQIFSHRRAIVARDATEAVTALRSPAKLHREETRLDTPVAFLFPGQGSQYAGAGAQLHRTEPVFRDALDECAEILRPELGRDLRDVLFATDEAAAKALRRTEFTQPAIFALGYALGRFWMSLGVEPAVLLGHSVGEFAAATLAGVFSLEDGARLVARRAQLVSEMPEGAMLAARLSETEAREFLSFPRVDIAAVNAPRLCVLAGSFDAIEAVEQQFRERSVPARRLLTSHAFHSPMVEPAVEAFAEAVREITLRAPERPLISSVSGTWMTTAQATSTRYWAQHLRATVRFADAVTTLWQEEKDCALLEVGPGNGLGQLARQCGGKSAGAAIAHSLDEHTAEPDALATAIGRLWLAGVRTDWRAVHRGEPRRKVALPGYPFEKRRFFADLPPGVPMPIVTAATDGDAPWESDLAAAPTPAAPAARAPHTERAEAPTESESPAAVAVARPAETALARIRQLLSELSGLDLSAATGTTRLLELGFDSLFLSGVAATLSRHCAKKITFRQLLQELGTLDELAAAVGLNDPSTTSPGGNSAEVAPATAATLATTPVHEAALVPLPSPASAGAALTPRQQRWLDRFLAHSRSVENGATSTSDADAEVFSGDLPMTEAQQEIWVVCQSGGLASSAFNESWTVRLAGPLDLAAMRQAIQTIINRHDALRSTFSRNGDTLTVAAQLELEVPFTDLSALGESLRDEEFRSLQTAEGTRVFDLVRGPLLALRIVRLAPEEHAIIFNGHHLICDGWSCNVFLTELAELYSARCEDRAAHRLPARAMQMREYVRWEAALRESGDGAADRAFWLAKYRRGIPEPLALPADRPHPAVRSFRGGMETLVVPHEFAQAATRFGAQHGVTLFTVLFAGFRAVLFRLSGQTDFAVGIPSAGQHLAGGDGLIGHCVNLLPLRAAIAPEQSFVAEMQALGDAVLEAFEHRRVTFGTLLRDLAVPRVAGRVPLVPVTFNVDPLHPPVTFAGLAHRTETSPRSAFQFDLSWNCQTAHDGFLIEAKYNADIFDAATIRHWLREYRALLEGALRTPSEPLTRLAARQFQDTPLPSAGTTATAEVPHPMPGEWNRTERPYPSENGVHRLFEEVVEKTPEAVAIDDGDELMSYAELNRRANYIAYHLAKLGVNAGTCVGICLERSSELIAGILGILKAGGTYVPLDPAMSRERLDAMLATTGAELVLTRRGSESELATSAARVVFSDEMGPVNGNGANPAPQSDRGDAIAYVMFTSGSTGTPKGVAIPHRGISRLVRNTNYIELGAADRIAHVSNPAFDASTFEIWGALLNGGRIVVIRKETLLTPRELARTLREKAVTTLFLTTPLFHQFAHAAPEAFGSLRHLLVGGDVLDPRAARAVLAAAPPAHLLHVYGPTETTTFATWHRMNAIAADARSVPIGAPIANTRVYLLDEKMKPVPAGERGEIYIGGPGVALGYVNRPDLTAEAFVPDPFSPEENARLYRTGDYARHLPDGQIDFLGRIDHQVKVRGFRVELGEIEAALQSHPAVRDCVAVAWRDPETRIVAYVVAGGDGTRIDTGELRDFLRARLPDFAVPAAIVVLDALPLSANGKVDRAALPAPDAGALGEGAAFERRAAPAAPHDLLEFRLLEIWESALNRRPIGVDDDFFALGGHSLLAVRVFAQIERQLGKSLPLSILLQAPTIRQLAAAMRREGVTAAWSTVVPIQPRGSRPPFFCLHGGDGGVLFHNPLAARLGSDQPMFGLQAQGLDGAEIRHTTVEAIADFYIAEIAAVQPAGPYYLGGYSFGGVVAFEMARQLALRGETVALLALFDTANPLIPPRRHRLHERIALRQRELTGMNLKQQFGHLSRRTTGMLVANWNAMREQVQSVAFRAARKDRGPIPTEYRNLHVRQVHLRALRAYRPQPYAGRLTLFRAVNGHDGYEMDAQLGWSGFVQGGIEVHDVPGTHETMFSEANVGVLGEKLTACLQNAQRDGAV